MSYRNFIIVAGLSFLADQLTKLWVVSHLYPFDTIKVLGDFLRFYLVYNTRGVFGISFGGGITYYILPIVGIGLIIYFARKMKHPIYSIAFGMILGGALGNLLDRIRLGKVVDFIDMGIGDIRWYTYNVADALIVIAVFLLFLAESKKR